MIVEMIYNKYNDILLEQALSHCESLSSFHEKQRIEFEEIREDQNKRYLEEKNKYLDRLPCTRINRMGLPRKKK